MARSELTEVIRRVQGMIAYVTNNLSTDEYMLFLDLLVPEPEPEPEAVKTVKKKRKAASKSPRSVSLAQHIKASRPLDGGVSKTRCELVGCGEHADHNVHHLESMVGYHLFTPPTPRIVQVGPDDICGKRDCKLRYANNVHHQTVHENYHPFVAPLFVPTAASPSPASNGAGSTTANSEDEMVSAGGVAREASGGD